MSTARWPKAVSDETLDALKAEIVETTFVVSRFSDIQKNFVPSHSQKKRHSFLPINDNTRPETTRNELIRGWKVEIGIIWPYFGNRKSFPLSLPKGSIGRKTTRTLQLLHGPDSRPYILGIRPRYIFGLSSYSTLVYIVYIRCWCILGLVSKSTMVYILSNSALVYLGFGVYSAFRFFGLPAGLWSRSLCSDLVPASGVDFSIVKLNCVTKLFCTSFSQKSWTSGNGENGLTTENENSIRAQIQ